jgi:lipopolysaccharide assembly outer membrane protein LptD (OstA)
LLALLKQFIILLTILISSNLLWASAEVLAITYTSPKLDSLSKTDSLPIKTIDSTVVQYSKDAPDSTIHYTANDSIFFNADSNKIYLWGTAAVQYKSMDLNSYHIVVDWKRKEVNAIGNIDSVNAKKGNPVFKDGDKSFNAKKIAYNFDTKKGKIYELLTKEDEGYIHSEEVKRIGDEEYYSKNALYTTCDDEHPHFAFKAKKMKVIPNKLIVTGPANLVVEDIPTPLYLPFGIFPISKGQTSGLLLPEPGQDVSKGFYLRHGGYYFAMGEHLDAAVTGDIYSYGSYGLHLNTNYSYKYKRSGNLSLSYGRTKLGDPQETGFKVLKDFQIQWSHNKDSRSNPNYMFSSSVRMGTSRYDRNNSYDVNDYLGNTYSSSISYQRLFPGKPINFSITAGHNQNNRTHQMNFDLPTINFNISRINPFTKKFVSSNRKWYEGIGFSYSLRALNHLDTYDTTLFKTQFSDFNAGVIHTIPVTASFNVAKYLFISPSFNYNERWYFSSITETRDTLDKVIINRKSGFKDERDWATGLNFSTTLFGLKNFKHGKLKALRHKFTPSVGLAYHPDYHQGYGYYQYTPPTHNGQVELYSVFRGNLIGDAPYPGKYGAVTFSVGNTLEMKIYDKKDSVNHTRKVSLLPSLYFGTSYNMAQDSFQWANINVSANTVILKKLNITYGMSLDPYSYYPQTLRRYNDLAIHHGSVGKVKNANVSLSTSIASKQPVANNFKNSKGTVLKTESIIPYTLSAYYVLSIQPSIFNFRDTVYYTQSVSGNLETDLTPNWKVSINTGYDFRTKTIGYSNISIIRDLHCWLMKINISPGHFYGIDINVKAAMLNDLKLSKRRTVNSYNY